MEADRECVLISSDSEDENPLLTTAERRARGGQDQPPATPATNNVSAGGLRYQDERKLPAYYNEDIIPDPETGRNLPVRILDYFYFCDAVQFVPLEQLDEAALLGYGLAVLPPEKTAELAEGAASSTAIAFEVDEWSIEYSSPPVLWLKSKRAWYQLLQPEPRYQRYFRNVQSKFDVCTGIYKLMEADKEVSYADVVAHMHDRYGITEAFLVKEAASVLKGLLEAYPEYRTTPFFRKLRDLATAEKSRSAKPKTSPRKGKEAVRAEESSSTRRRRRLCHHCKAESSGATDHRKCDDCRKVYCGDCLKDNYEIKLSAIEGTPWVCLACEGLCACKACLKSNGDGASKAGRKKRKAASAADGERKLRRKEDEKRRRLARDAGEAARESEEEPKEEKRERREAKEERRRQAQAEPPDPQAAAMSQPLGYDRHGNRYWWIREPLSPRKQAGRVFVEQGPNQGGCPSQMEVLARSFYETKEGLARLMRELNVNDVRERALYPELKRCCDNIPCTEERQRRAEVGCSRAEPTEEEEEGENEEEDDDDDDEGGEEEEEDGGGGGGGRPADKRDEGNKAKEAGSKRDVRPPVSLEQIRERMLGLELSLSPYMLLDRLAYTKEIPVWRQKVAKEGSPAELCALMLFVEAHLTSEALMGWHDSPMQKIWRRFCRGREATSLREAALALDHLEGAIQWRHAKHDV